MNLRFKHRDVARIGMATLAGIATAAGQGLRTLVPVRSISWLFHDSIRTWPVPRPMLSARG